MLTWSTTASAAAALRGAAARMQSTVAPAAGAAAAPAAPAAPPAPAPLAVADAVNTFRERGGQAVTQSWNRYTLEAPGSYTLAEARSTSVLAGTTEWTGNKKAVIYKVSKPAMTSGTGSSKWWSIRWDKRAAWANPLMGWLSSADTHQALNMHTRFESADEAIAFAERNGWKYELQRPFTRVPGRVDSMYAYNFVPVAVQTKLDTLGPRKARYLFEHGGDTTRRSQWVNWRRTQFGAEPWKPASYQTQAAWMGPGWPAAKLKEPSADAADA